MIRCDVNLDQIRSENGERERERSAFEGENESTDRALRKVFIRTTSGACDRKNFNLKLCCFTFMGLGLARTRTHTTHSTVPAC